ncbi:Spliceosomal protein FBP11/Splicing factor PRP40 [Phytophthora cinnamomi]|uniref:Spliceosomal protein FBP11/Splicing factor PRP40 n=1 Tax=Phytophthora cinnamomi TaxID=4785 RepID=UPI0035594B8E|nr:Spliceosomal protein FBP11/Splicing factor PRP40 [Phytophthora cinnamomi]
MNLLPLYRLHLYPVFLGCSALGGFGLCQWYHATDLQNRELYREMSLKYMLTAVPQLLAALLLLYYACTYSRATSAFVHRMLVESCLHQGVVGLMVASLLFSAFHLAMSVCCSSPAFCPVDPVSCQLSRIVACPESVAHLPHYNLLIRGDPGPAAHQAPAPVPRCPFASPMSHYGPSSSSSGGAYTPRGGPPPFRGPPSASTSAFPPPFRPPFAARGPPPAFAFRGPPPAFRGPPPGLRPPLGLNIPPPMAFQAPPSPANAGPLLPPGWSEHRTPHGATYYYNAATGVSTYDLPAPVEPRTPRWAEYKDDATGAFYYFNTVTKETVWDQPEEFRMQKAREQVAKMTMHAASPVAAQMQTHFHSQVQGQGQVQAPEHGSSASTEKEDEDDEEEIKRQEAQEQARRKRKEEQEREQAAQFTDMPRAERMAAFKQFLEDKQITPTLKWGDAQRTISKDASMHNDSRWKFALNTVGEKKQAYAEYCTQAKNRATIEKRRLVKKTREEFTELLTLFESTLAPASRRRPVSWEEMMESNNFYALRKDPRWSAIEETREKQQLFATFMQDLERNQKARLAKRQEALQAAFMDLLRQRAEAKELELSAGRSGKRLDSDTKRRVLDLLEEVELPGGGGKRELEHAKRKRERAERAEREEKLGRDLNEQLQELAASQKLTVGGTWTEFSAEHLKHASEQQAKASKSEAEGDADEDEEEDGHDGDGEQLHWKTQRRIFDKFVRRLRRNLEPAATAIREHLDRSGEPPLRVTECTTYAVFVDALESGVGVALDNNAPEEGEEEVVEEMDTSKEPAKKDTETGTGEGEKIKKLTAEEVNAALEAVVKAQREKQGDTTPVEFPAFVRQVYDMWVAMAKEDIRRVEEKKARHRKRSRKESRDLAPEDEDDEDRPRRSRRRSSAADELEDDKTHRRRRHRGSRKRRRSHGSPSVSRSRSRSRSESRRESRRSRLDRSRSRSRNRSRSRSRDREGELPPSLAAAVNVKPVAETASTEPYSPIRNPTKVLTEAEEAAKAEEIIRQARLKLQAKSKSNSDDSELEEGEEPEEGEEVEE